MKRRLVIYAKRPLPGYAKTRLGAEIGAACAAGVYARLLYAYLLDVARAGWTDIEVLIAVAGKEDVSFFERAFPEFAVCPQVEGDLGERMRASFREAFAAGVEQVVLTGSDIPGLGRELVGSAFGALETTPAVVGPAADGGYYLLGMRAPGADLFAGVTWSSALVLAQTQALAAAHGISLAYLPTQSDVDTAADLVAWQAGRARGAAPSRSNTSTG